MFYGKKHYSMAPWNGHHSSRHMPFSIVMGQTTDYGSFINCQLNTKYAFWRTLLYLGLHTFYTHCQTIPHILYARR